MEVNRLGELQSCDDRIVELKSPRPWEIPAWGMARREDAQRGLDAGYLIDASKIKDLGMSTGCDLPAVSFFFGVDHFGYEFLAMRDCAEGVKVVKQRRRIGYSKIDTCDDQVMRADMGIA